MRRSVKVARVNGIKKKREQNRLCGVAFVQTQNTVENMQCFQLLDRDKHRCVFIANMNLVVLHLFIYLLFGLIYFGVILCAYFFFVRIQFFSLSRCVLSSAICNGNRLRCLNAPNRIGLRKRQEKRRISALRSATKALTK